MVTGYMSLWSEPALAKSGSFNEEFLMLWALSLQMAKKVFNEVVLVTDEYGAKLLDGFGYDKVFVDLGETFVTGQARSVWAAGKFVAFNRAIGEGKPFCHFDGDVILLKYQKAFDAPVFAQCMEQFHAKRPSSGPEENLRNIYLMGGAMAMPYMPEFVRLSLTREQHGPFNVGVCGGSDMEFWKDFSDTSLSVLRHGNNSEFWHTMHPTFASLFVEQYMMGAIAVNRGTKVETLFPFCEAQNEDLMHKLGYIHLLGDSKHKPDAVWAINHKMKVMFPWLYDKIKAMNLPHFHSSVSDIVTYYGYGHCSS